MPGGLCPRGLDDDKIFDSFPFDFHGAPRVIRTPDLRIRSPSLYPAELWAQKKQFIGERLRAQVP